MVNFILSHKIIVVIVALLVAVGVWIGLSSSESPGSLLAVETVAEQGASQDLVSTLLALRAVKLDASLFTDPAFVSLNDFSTQIVPEPVGRPNPFAPLGSSAVVNASTTKAAQIFTAPKTR
jgi:hypothetical protein